MPESRADIIKHFCYEPLSWQKSVGYHVSKDDNKCRAPVPDRGRSPLSHQCGRVASQTVEGLRFCGLHAKQLRDYLEAVNG